MLGRHRSGTTWFSNLLASLPEVYAPAHELHRGVHESAYFSHLLPYCRWGRSEADLLAIKCLFERSDYFLLTGLESGPDIVEVGCVRYFGLLMDAAARRHGARYWLEKTPAHSLLAGYLAKSFPDAVFLAVVRRARDVVVSNVHGFGNPRSFWTWFRQAAVTEVYEKVIRRRAALIVHYEDLVRDRCGTMRIVAETLALDPERIPEDVYGRNSSHQDGTPRVEWWQSAAMACGRTLARMWPDALVELGARRWALRKTGRLPGWFFLLASGPRGIE